MSYYEVVICRPAGASFRCGHHHATPGKAEKCRARIKGGVLRGANFRDWYGAYIIDNNGVIYDKPTIAHTPAPPTEHSADSRIRLSGDAEAGFWSARERCVVGLPRELCRSTAECDMARREAQYEEDQEYGGGGKHKFIKN